MAPKKSQTPMTPPTEAYRHPEASSLLRPDVGTQAQFKKKKPPKQYHFDSSLSPAMDWDGGNSSRELGEWLLDCIERASRLDAPHRFPEPQVFRDNQGQALSTIFGLRDAVEAFRQLAKPFLDWSGKAERLSFSVPTLPLFVHERLSTKAILETLKGHKQQASLFDLFGDPERPIYEQVLRAYEYADGWTNRMILGDSLVVMNSLLEYEGMGGLVQMIYMDPPYGVKFGSNFQPFVRKRDVVHNDDEDMTREPEMVKAYRDTWELGLHSYLTYMRDRLLASRELLAPSGSVFVQISDENLHHVRELMDEVFGADNCCGVITFTKTSGQTNLLIPVVADFLLWYAKDRERVKFHQLYERKAIGGQGATEYFNLELADGEVRRLSASEAANPSLVPANSKVFATDSIVSDGYSQGNSQDIELEHDGQKFVLRCGPKRHWKVGTDGIRRLWDKGRLLRREGLRIYRRYFEDFPYIPVSSVWTDTRGETDMSYVVQTSTKVIQRCLLMTTDPGDLVLDPTCGGGTTARVAEHWGRRWITIDVSRVPLALARERLLTATFPFYELRGEARGPAGGFVYRSDAESRNPKPVGPGIVPHTMMEDLAKDEPSKEEVLVDRPEELGSITRVSGPFSFEATIPTPVDWEDGPGSAEAEQDSRSFVDRMLEVLRQSPILHLGGGKSVTMHNVRPPAKSLTLSAEALVDATAPGQAPSIMDAVTEVEEKDGRMLPLSRKPVAIVFGPESGAVSERLVYEAARESRAKGYTYLYVIGFAIQPNARELVEKSEDVVGIPATYVQATPDLIMGDLLKNMRSSQIFSVCGLPEIKIGAKKGEAGGPTTYAVELLGLDVFDPTTMAVEHRKGDDVPAWFLDTNYNNLCFHVTQAFFPRTAAWDSLKRSLRGVYDDSVWDHLAGAISASFEAGDHGQVAVKVIDDRGNELLVVKSLKGAQP